MSSSRPAVLFAEREGFSVEIDEDEAEHRVDPDLFKRKRRLVEIADILAAARRPQGPVEIVGPGMVGACHDGPQSAAALEDAVRPVLAHIVEAAQDAITTPDESEALVGDVHHPVTARRLERAFVPDKQP